jgi:hypothetical protein
VKLGKGVILNLLCQDYYLNPDEKAILKVYREKVREAFYPKRGFGFRLATGKKAISDFRKLKPAVDSLIDLMLYYVECGVEFTNDYGDIDENYYLSLERAYRDSLTLIDKHLLHGTFKDRALKVVNDTINTGWGFYDTLADFYYEVYAEED